MGTIDQVYLNFNPQTLTLLNIILGFVMFGVALDLKIDDFKNVLASPKPFLLGMTAQFILLPAFTFLLILIIDPIPSIAMGMIVVASCPGGNISNFITHIAKGNTALSISMSAVSTALAIIMTPINITFWGSMHPETKAILQEVTLDPIQMVIIIFLLLGLPLALGIYFSKLFPVATQKIKKWMRYFSIVFFVTFVIVSLIANFEYFLDYVGYVVIAVFLHNATAISSGYMVSKLFKISEANKRAVAIEVGIQNSGLGLIIIFNFFGGLGGMAIVAAWWGIWHIISGFSLAFFWRKRPPDNYQSKGVTL